MRTNWGHSAHASVARGPDGGECSGSSGRWSVGGSTPTPLVGTGRPPSQRVVGETALPPQNQQGGSEMFQEVLKATQTLEKVSRDEIAMLRQDLKLHIDSTTNVLRDITTALEGERQTRKAEFAGMMTKVHNVLGQAAAGIRGELDAAAKAGDKSQAMVMELQQDMLDKVAETERKSDALVDQITRTVMTRLGSGEQKQTQPAPQPDATREAAAEQRDAEVRSLRDEVRQAMRSINEVRAAAARNVGQPETLEALRQEVQSLQARPLHDEVRQAVQSMMEARDAASRSTGQQELLETLRRDVLSLQAAMQPLQSAGVDLATCHEELQKLRQQVQAGIQEASRKAEELEGRVLFLAANNGSSSGSTTDVTKSQEAAIQALKAEASKTSDATSCLDQQVIALAKALKLQTESQEALAQELQALREQVGGASDALTMEQSERKRACDAAEAQAKHIGALLMEVSAKHATTFEDLQGQFNSLQATVQDQSQHLTTWHELHVQVKALVEEQSKAGQQATLEVEELREQMGTLTSSLARQSENSMTRQDFNVQAEALSKARSNDAEKLGKEVEDLSLQIQNLRAVVQPESGIVLRRLEQQVANLENDLSNGSHKRDQGYEELRNQCESLRAGINHPETKLSLRRLEEQVAAVMASQSDLTVKLDNSSQELSAKLQAEVEKMQGVCREMHAAKKADEQHSPQSTKQSWDKLESQLSIRIGELQGWCLSKDEERTKEARQLADKVQRLSAALDLRELRDKPSTSNEDVQSLRQSMDGLAKSLADLRVESHATRSDLATQLSRLEEDTARKVQPQLAQLQASVVALQEAGADTSKSRKTRDDRWSSLEQSLTGLETTLQSELTRYAQESKKLLQRYEDMDTCLKQLQEEQVQSTSKLSSELGKLSASVQASEDRVSKALDKEAASQVSLPVLSRKVQDFADRMASQSTKMTAMSMQMERIESVCSELQQHSTSIGKRQVEMSELRQEVRQMLSAEKDQRHAACSDLQQAVSQSSALASRVERALRELQLDISPLLSTSARSESRSAASARRAAAVDAQQASISSLHRPPDVSANHSKKEPPPAGKRSTSYSRSDASLSVEPLQWPRRSMTGLPSSGSAKRANSPSASDASDVGDLARAAGSASMPLTGTARAKTDHILKNLSQNLASAAAAAGSPSGGAKAMPAAAPSELAQSSPTSEASSSVAGPSFKSASEETDRGIEHAHSYDAVRFRSLKELVDPPSNTPRSFRATPPSGDSGVSFNWKKDAAKANSSRDDEWPFSQAKGPPHSARPRDVSRAEPASLDSSGTKSGQTQKERENAAKTRPAGVAESSPWYSQFIPWYTPQQGD